jgi:predicted Zn-dependent peptidase
MKKSAWVCVWVLLSLGSASAQQERFRKSPPIPDPLPQLELPAVESARLMNGLTLAVISRPDQPCISLELIIMAGESRSPQNLPGLASFTAEMLSRGTPLVSAAELEDRIDAIGGDFSTTTTPDFCRFSLRFLDGYLEQALETLALMVLQSNFHDREIVALKRTQFYDLKQKQRDPEFVGRRQLLRVLFNGHPYGRSFFSEDVFKNITRRDVQAFYESYYRPNNALIVLAGNLDMPMAMKTVSHFLNTWPRREIEPPVLPAPSPNAEERYCFVELPQAQATTLVIGNVIVPRVESDHFPLAVLNQILGGTPFSRLFMNLREAKAYAYSAFSRLEFFRSCGFYELSAAVIPSAASSSVREILGELEQIKSNRVSNFELEQAKSYLIGHFPLQVNRLDQLNRRISEILAFSLGDAQWGRFNDNISLVDAERIFEAAQRYFLLKPVVVIVGDGSTLLEHLRDIDRLEVYDLKGVLLYTRIKGVEG